MRWQIYRASALVPPWLHWRLREKIIAPIGESEDKIKARPNFWARFFVCWAPMGDKSQLSFASAPNAQFVTFV